MLEKQNGEAIDVVEGLAGRMRGRQVMRPGDVQDAEGQVICGKCGQYRRKYRLFPAPEPGNPAAMKRVLITLACRCDVEEDRLEREEYRRKEMRRLSLMDERYSTARLATFDTRNGDEKLYQLCRRYVERFKLMEENNQGILLWGDKGAGKTFAAATIANELLDRGKSVIMTSFVKIMQYLQGDKEEARDIFNRVRTAELVILDDLGAERSTSYALEQVYNVIDSRYRASRPMILTTNMSVDAMRSETDVRYGRIYERILASCYCMHVEGHNWRQMEAMIRHREMERLLFS